MKMFRRYLGLLLVFGLAPLMLRAQSGTVNQVELRQFHLQSSDVVHSDGSSLSQVSYEPSNYWFPVKVPCTVLTGLVANKVYPDPYIGMNNMLIPDANDSFNLQYHLAQYSFLPNHPNPWKDPYWYRTEFTVPASDHGKTFQLIFKGINYRAAVWVNGIQIADSSEMVGMFEQFTLDVTRAIHVGKKNALAVEIYPLDYPGLPSHPQLDALGDFYANGGPTGDIGKNVTMLCSAGWDWIPAVRDRNMGIWQPVFLRTSGSVTIDRPHVVTDLPNLPDTNLAQVQLGLNLTNHGSRTEQGILSVHIAYDGSDSRDITIDKDVTVPAGKSLDVAMDAAQFKKLIIEHPKLWWPNGYGSPNLYTIRLEFKDSYGTSDDTTFHFGIRTVSSQAVNVNGFWRRDFYVNGRKIHLDGGAWVPDMMLNRDSTRYDYEIRLNRNANINLLRIWGGGVTPPDVFFDLADKYGMLVWSDFWITGDTNGEFKGSSDNPLEGRVFIDNVISTIYRIRNHPSLLLWTGGNEGHARKELYDAMRNNVIKLDGTRPFIPCSSGFAKLPEDWKQSWPDNKPSGVYSGGSYAWQDPAFYYQKVDQGRDWVFKDETGLPSQGPYYTLPQIVPNLVPDTSLPYPLNNTWGYHDACSGNGHYELYYKAMTERFGMPTSMQDYCEKMQLMNADGYRGIFEAAGHKLNETGGVMLWKLNAAFPSVIWQVYDWYLEPNAGYYFMQRACEPVHIQLNLDDSTVAVINRSVHDASALTADVSIYDLDGEPIYHHSQALSVKTYSTQEVMPISAQLAQHKGICFVLLTLMNTKGDIISHNTYWMSPNHDFKALTGMPKARVTTSVVSSTHDQANRYWTLTFSNPSSEVAFFVNPRLTNGKTGKEILPAFWSNNYFSLAPGQSLTVQVSCPLAILHNDPADIVLQGWNLPDSDQ